MKFPRKVVKVGSCIAKIKEGRWGNTTGEPNLGDGEYTKTIYEGEKWVSHRLSFHLNVHSIPRRLKSRKVGLVLHTCDHKWCINPDHLYLGTSAKNAQDNAKRNLTWRRHRSEAQKRIGFPPVSKEGRAKTAMANSINTKQHWDSLSPKARKARIAGLQAWRSK